MDVYKRGSVQRLIKHFNGIAAKSTYKVDRLRKVYICQSTEEWRLPAPTSEVCGLRHSQRYGRQHISASLGSTDVLAVTRPLSSDPMVLASHCDITPEPLEIDAVRCRCRKHQSSIVRHRSLATVPCNWEGHLIKWMSTKMFLFTMSRLIARSIIKSRNTCALEGEELSDSQGDYLLGVEEIVKRNIIYVSTLVHISKNRTPTHSSDIQPNDFFENEQILFPGGVKVISFKSGCFNWLLKEIVKKVGVGS